MGVLLKDKIFCVRNEKYFVRNNNGQALIELIIFLPLMFIFYSMISGFANSINSSINQQKVARSYFYYRVQHNPFVPKPNKIDSGGYVHQGWGTFGMFYIGWKDYFIDSRPIAPCYKVSAPLVASEGDKCEDSYQEPTTQYIRVQTVYGFCGATFQNTGQYVLPVPDFPGGDFNILTNSGGCVITQ
jgi:hypothetical protein